MQLSQAIDGFLLFKEAAGLRPATIRGYRYSLESLVVWLGDRPLEQLTTNDINRFLLYLRNDYQPKRLGGDTSPLSSQSVYNTYTALKSFTRWLNESLEMPDLMSNRVPRPRVMNEEQHPFTEGEVKTLINSIKPMKGRRATSGLYYLVDLRDRALVLTLLDTGIRAGEVCRLVIGDVHFQSGQVTIAEGKGGKPRQVWIGKSTRAAVWRYVQERQTADPALPLFAAIGDSPMTRSALRKRLMKIGLRAGVQDVHPHRFRYTFAIQYLRNGGDIFTLQQLLGHTTMTMVQYYLKLAQADLEEAHRRASPVDNWLK